jgi:hypothetical protein
VPRKLISAAGAGPQPPPGQRPTIETSSAGASAQREHDRRVEKRGTHDPNTTCTKCATIPPTERAGLKPINAPRRRRPGASQAYGRRYPWPKT